MTCQYGCGRPAKYKINGIDCCSPNFFSCPGWVKKMKKDVEKQEEEKDERY